MTYVIVGAIMAIVGYLIGFRDGQIDERLFGGKHTKK